MNITLHHHNWHQFDPTPQASAFTEELVAVAARAPVYIWPGKSKRSDKVKDHCVLQSAINIWFELELLSLGWSSETAVTKDRNEWSTYRVDFSREITDSQPTNLDNHCMAEVEFGNSARLDSNLRKLLDSYNWGRLHVGAILLPRTRMAKVTTGGSVSFESAISDVTRCHPKTVPFPLCLIGLDHHNSELVDLSTALDIPNSGYLSGNNDKSVIRHLITQHRAGVPVTDICLPHAIHSPMRVAAPRVSHSKTQPSFFD
ncbi:MAG: hypothetical protein Q7S87_01155 [Agitococcus sp.]|nr:hypothetical protein [Agitococcus sp.]MDO9179134.1 hypothetical protein [Agitococcus sp.]